MTRPAVWSRAQMPPRLRPGDRIAVPAPSGPIADDGAFERGLARLGERYRVVVGDDVRARTGYLAGDDARRAAELNRYLADPDVRAIVCARGGYGLLRILPELDADALRRDPKPVVGFSDATALLAWCVAAAAVRPIHGPMVAQLGRLGADDLAWLCQRLEDPAPAGELPGPAMTRAGKRGGGTLEGRLVGGNLELVTRLLGTPWQLDLGASVFFFEEVGERPYRIDRQLTQLSLAGALAGVRAVAVGELTRCDEPPESRAASPTAIDVVSERLAAFELPGLVGLPVGHGDRNLALPLGVKCAVDLGRGRIVIEEGAVA